MVPSSQSSNTVFCRTRRNMANAITTKLHLLFVLNAATCWFSAVGTTFPELKPYLWEHQDSFKVLLQPSYFVLLQRSFEHDPGFFWDGDCIYGRMFEFYPEEKYAMGTVLHWSPFSNILVNRTVYLTAEATEDYPVGNVYTSSPISTKILTLQYIIMASEYDNCDILRVPHGENGCEIWVRLDKINETHSLCFFIYDLLCGPQKFITYDQDKCRNKTII
uniref:Lipocalin/cytosolic fatty-acid binding domain-containing protein n=1 Tax=Amblyomma maculatum TaxID=34609 RepID=G3MPZ1_AMBMU